MLMLRHREEHGAFPEDLETIILTAMAKDPDHRYQSAEDFRADLVRFRRGRPLAAVPLTAAVEEVDNDATVAALRRVSTATLTTQLPSFWRIFLTREKCSVSLIGL